MIKFKHAVAVAVLSVLTKGGAAQAHDPVQSPCGMASASVGPAIAQGPCSLGATVYDTVAYRGHIGPCSQAAAGRLRASTVSAAPALPLHHPVRTGGYGPDFVIPLVYVGPQDTIARPY